MENHFQTVKLMIENLRSVNPDLRLESMQGIQVISRTLGPRRTRDELLLYLTDFLDDNDEVLQVFAKALGTMLTEVGGVAFVQSLLQPLEMLCNLDEITVRTEAVHSLQILSGHIFLSSSGAEQRAQYESLVERLCQATPQCRSSASMLMASLYSAATSVVAKDKIRETFATLVGDTEIMVRHAACVALADNFVKVLSPSECVTVIPFLKSFATDESDGVRVRAVTSCAAVLSRISKAHRGQILLLIHELSSDKSWRVRYMMADTLGTLSNALSSTPDVERYVVPIFQRLCEDEVGEVRASAVFSMASVLAACSDVNAKHTVLSAGTDLISYPISHVRVSLATSLLRSVAHLPKNLWAEMILPACKTLLQDSETEVRLALLSGFSSMGTTREAKELAPQLVSIILERASDPQWRLREVVLQQLPYLITSLEGDASEVLDVCVERMLDHAFIIRDAAVQASCKLVSEKGIAWSAQHLFPRMLAIAKNPNYLFRIALCRWFAGLACVAAMDEASCMKYLWPVIVQLRMDPVSNVRLNIAKAVGVLFHAGKVPSKEAELLLSKLAQDSTEDVREVAEIARK